MESQIKRFIVIIIVTAVIVFGSLLFGDNPDSTNNISKSNSFLSVNYQPVVFDRLNDSLPSNMPLNTRLLWGNKGLFRSINLVPDSRSKELNLRRNMLQWHQRLGFVTLAAMAAQVSIGKKLYAGNYTQERQNLHKQLGYTSYGLYLTTASLSLLAPPARLYSKKMSSIKIHRYLALVHFSAMMIQPWIGRKAANANDADDYRRLIDLHNQVGTVAMVSLSLAFLTTWLP